MMRSRPQTARSLRPTPPSPYLMTSSLPSQIGSRPSTARVRPQSSLPSPSLFPSGRRDLKHPRVSPCSSSPRKSLIDHSPYSMSPSVKSPVKRRQRLNVKVPQSLSSSTSPRGRIPPPSPRRSRQLRPQTAPIPASRVHKLLETAKKDDKIGGEMSENEVLQMKKVLLLKAFDEVLCVKSSLHSSVRLCLEYISSVKVFRGATVMQEAEAMLWLGKLYASVGSLDEGNMCLKNARDLLVTEEVSGSEGDDKEIQELEMRSLHPKWLVVVRGEGICINRLRQRIAPMRSLNKLRELHEKAAALYGSLSFPALQMVVCMSFVYLHEKDVHQADGMLQLIREKGNMRGGSWEEKALYTWSLLLLARLFQKEHEIEMSSRVLEMASDVYKRELGEEDVKQSGLYMMIEGKNTELLLGNSLFEEGVIHGSKTFQALSSRFGISDSRVLYYGERVLLPAFLNTSRHEEAGELLERIIEVKKLELNEMKKSVEESKIILKEHENGEEQEEEISYYLLAIRVADLLKLLGTVCLASKKPKRGLLSYKEAQECYACAGRRGIESGKSVSEAIERMSNKMEEEKGKK